jgi:glyoxylase-like metal-dependent hydrolase (beta-lactamase superfamily II)
VLSLAPTVRVFVAVEPLDMRGSFDALAAGIRHRLYTLPDDTIVFPGHGRETTVGHEKRHNPFVPGAPAKAGD